MNATNTNMNMIKKDNSISLVNLKTTTSLFFKNEIVNTKQYRKSILQLKNDLNNSQSFLNKYNSDKNISSNEDKGIINVELNNNIRFENNYIDKNELRIKNRILYNKRNLLKKENLINRKIFEDKHTNICSNDNLGFQKNVMTNFNDNNSNTSKSSYKETNLFNENDFLKTSTNIKKTFYNNNYNNEFRFKSDNFNSKSNINYDFESQKPHFSNLSNSNEKINILNLKGNHKPIHKLNLNQYKLALKANLNEKDFVFSEDENYNKLTKKSIKNDRFSKKNNFYSNSVDFNCLQSIKSEFIKTDIEFNKESLFSKNSKEFISKNLDFSSYSNLGKTRKLKDLKKTIKNNKPSNIYEIENKNKVIKPHELELKNKVVKKSQNDVDKAIIKSIFNKPMVFRDKNSKLYRLDFKDYEKLIDDDVLKKSELVDLKVLNTQKKTLFVKNVIDNIYPKVMKMRTHYIKSSFGISK